jgi:hypothetical protein
VWLSIDGGLDGKLLCLRAIWFSGRLFVWDNYIDCLIMIRVMQLSSACYAPVSLDHITNFRLCILHYRLTHPRSLSPTYPDLSNKLHQIFYKTFVGCHTRIHTFRSLEPVSIPQTSEFALSRILLFE